MKKTLILSLIIVLAAIGPVSAAGIDFSGAIETQIEVNKKEENLEVVPGSELSLNLDLSAAQDKVRAGVELGLEKELEELMPSALSLGDITLKQAFIEADGPFWNGGPEATTRFGTLDIGYSPYATLKKRSGISISGVDLDLVSLNGFYGLPLNEGEVGQGHVLGFHSTLDLIEEVDLGAAVIADDELIRFQADAAAELIDGLQAAGSFAADKKEESLNSLWKVKADYALAEETKVIAGYKYISADWTPGYVAEKTKEGKAEHDWIHLERAKHHGLFVGLKTAQQGVNMEAAYDQMFAEASIAADTEYDGFNFEVSTVLDVPAVSGITTKSTKFAVDRDVEIMDGLVLNGKYQGEWTGEEGLVHTLGASTTLGLVPAVEGLELSAEVSASKLDWDSVGYKVGAEFAAPNGVNLGIEHDRQEGTTFNAGMKVEF
ncbi:MAG: hypothetical protein GX335_07620 [Firmicutes bacterium]|nr:hypothetical protein [Bacillota bacterium]